MDNNALPRDCIDYEKGPKLQYLWCESESDDGDEPLQGQTLYLGGEVVDRSFYCIPGHAPRVMVCDIDTNKVKRIGPKWPGKFKWLRGIVVNDIIYGLPCHADSVLRIDTKTNQVTTIPIPYEVLYKNDLQLAEQQRKLEWKYHGGSVCPADGKIYTIPQSALHVLCIDPATDSLHLFGSALEGRWKWYGGVVGRPPDNAIYGIPHDSAHVLRIHPDTGVTLHGNFGSGGHKWHGASGASNGDIVSVPANADSVLVIRPGYPEPELFQLGDSNVIVTGRHRRDKRYKFLGASAGSDGMVYCFPSGSERVLQIDPVARTVRQVGPNVYEQRLERLCQNKWQNGVSLTNERLVFAIPLAAESVLQIDYRTDPPIITTWQLPAPHKGLAKWEGGTVAPNGAIYCVPNNHKAILRIEPSSFVTDDDVGNGHLKHYVSRREAAKQIDWPYLSGIPTLRSSAHRVKCHKRDRKHDPLPRNREGSETGTPWLPQELVKEAVFALESAENLEALIASVRCMLRQCDPQIVGAFRNDSDRLEDFVVPPSSTWRTANGGQCEEAQRYLSEVLHNDELFLKAFDKLVVDDILPYVKRRLVALEVATEMEGSVAFFYQRPPTIRLQPGPAWSQVQAHNDAEYGHQNGELNFWIPFTDRALTKVDLWAESEPNIGNFHPLAATLGKVVAFHGSSCRHYVNPNETIFTRVSMDFRVGVEGYFDPEWEMRGTTDDHLRCEIRL
ncbi:hypothetical protein MPSEU_000373300 [Mayamaea pseudoterrestris]|nr:hypothetical protein MPSEU_000373300 [Mayamaea pseudoterrestris]